MKKERIGYNEAAKRVAAMTTPPTAGLHEENAALLKRYDECHHMIPCGGISHELAAALVRTDEKLKECEEERKQLFDCTKLMLLDREEKRADRDRLRLFIQQWVYFPLGSMGEEARQAALAGGKGST